jgi:hypothetical protein
MGPAGVKQLVKDGECVAVIAVLGKVGRPKRIDRDQ